MKKLLFICSVIAMTGCAGNAPSPQVKEAALNPLICEEKDQCELYWQRAMFYVNNNSKYKIQTSNDNLIQTYSPTNADPSVGYNISREPLGNNRFRIWVKVFCANMFGCQPETFSEMAKVKSYIKNGGS